MQALPHPLPLLILFAIAILLPLPPFCELWHFYINCFVVVFIEIFEVTFAIVAFGQLPEREREREKESGRRILNKTVHYFCLFVDFTSTSVVQFCISFLCSVFFSCCFFA